MEKLSLVSGTSISIPRRCNHQILRGKCWSRHARGILATYNIHPSSWSSYIWTYWSIPEFVSVCCSWIISIARHSLLFKRPGNMQYKGVFNDDMPTPSNFDQELKLWRRKWLNIEEPPSTLPTAIHSTNALMFPNIHRIFTLLLLIPVSSATVERGNSALKSIKTSQRSTMGQERLNALTLLQIHRDIELNYQQIVDIFIRKNPRRMTSNNPLK